MSINFWQNIDVKYLPVGFFLLRDLCDLCDLCDFDSFGDFDLFLFFPDRDLYFVKGFSFRGILIEGILRLNKHPFIIGGKSDKSR